MTVMVLPLRSLTELMPAWASAAIMVTPLAPSTATAFTGTPLARTMIGVSPMAPPTRALPAPICLATSTPPLPAMKVTLRFCSA
ncbi:hypothetical protein D3C78_1365840 [compost metagenome]